MATIVGSTEDEIRDGEPFIPRVLLLSDSLSRNGAVHIIVGLARRWAPHGAVLAALRPAEGAGVDTDGVRTVQLLSRGRRLRYSLPQAMTRMTRLARRSDVVVTGSEIGPALLLGFVAARLTRRPFIVSVHAELDRALDEWMPRWTHPLFAWVEGHADGAICIAPAVVPPVRDNGLSEDRIRVVRNGIDTGAVARAAKAPADMLSPGPPVVVATGRLARQKANDLLIRAHARVVRDRPHRVLLLNDGPERSALEALTAELGVEDTVRILPDVASPLPYVARADLFCLPSRHEGLPLALLEAVSLGVPVLAADCSPGVRDALDDGRVGELLPVDDVAALAAALDRHLSDPSVLRQRAARGPEHARSFDIDAMAAGWARAIDELVRT